MEGSAAREGSRAGGLLLWGQDSLPVAPPAGGGGGVLDRGSAAPSRAEATSKATGAARAEASSQVMATAVGIAAAAS